MDSNLEESRLWVGEERTVRERDSLKWGRVYGSTELLRDYICRVGSGEN